MIKKYFFIMLISAVSYSQGWFIQQTFSPAQSLQTIRFWDANTGYTTAPLYNGSNFCIHKTTNAGVNWVDQNAGYTAMRFMAMYMVHPDTVYMSGNDGTIIKTVNGGANWTTVFTEATLQLWGLYFTNSFTGYTSGSSGRIMKTTNAGVNWVNLASPTATSLNSIYFLNENTGFISGYAIALKTTNAGASWVNMNAPFISGFENFREIYFFDENNGLYVSDAGRIGKTTNGGANWNIIPSGTSESLFSVKFTDAMTGYACGNNGAIIRTTNGGDNWSTQTSPLNEILTDVWFTSPTTGYISTWSGKVLKTTNGGLTFIAPISSEVPSSYSLGQNYPNPFNPATNIKFQVTKNELTTLKVYDILGNEVEALVSEMLTPGTYEVNWNASAYPSGIYFYTLSSGSFSQTNKMILVK